MSVPNAYPLEPLFRAMISPFERFLHRTTAGGLVLLAATAAAIAWASIAGHDAYEGFWQQRVFPGFERGDILDLDLHGWVNEGLMTLFFLLVGLEIKREILVGELSSARFQSGCRCVLASLARGAQATSPG